MKNLAFVIMAATLGLSAAANAQQAQSGGNLRQLCAADLQTFCAGMKGPDARKCLMTNISKVSQPCGTALANSRSAMREYMQACGADIRQYCGSQPAGPQRHQCVTANQAQFSQACQSAIAAQQGGGQPAPAQ